MLAERAPGRWVRVASVLLFLTLTACSGGSPGGADREQVAAGFEASADRLDDLQATVDELTDRVEALEAANPGEPALDDSTVSALCARFDELYDDNVTPALGVVGTFVEGYVRFEGDGADLLAVYDGQQGMPNGEVLPAGAMRYRMLPAPPGQDYARDLAEGTPATRADIEEWRSYTLVLDGNCRVNDVGPDAPPSSSIELALRTAG